MFSIHYPPYTFSSSFSSSFPSFLFLNHSFFSFFSFFCFLSRFAGASSSVSWRAPWRGISPPAVERHPTAGMAAMARRVVADARLNQNGYRERRSKLKSALFLLVPTSDMQGQACDCRARMPCECSACVACVACAVPQLSEKKSFLYFEEY